MKTMKKLLSIVLAGLLILSVGGCKIEVKDTTEVQNAWEVLQPDGTILVDSFDYPSLKSFLHRTTEVKDYHIIIHSPGGVAVNCVAMMNRIADLQRQGAVITTEVLGMGLSGGALLFIMGDNRIIHDGAVLMFHSAGFVWSGERMNAKKLYKTGNPDMMPSGDFLSMLDDRFAKRMKELGLTDKEVEDWLYHEDANFMNAAEALELNLANGLIN